MMTRLSPTNTFAWMICLVLIHLHARVEQIAVVVLRGIPRLRHVRVARHVHGDIHAALSGGEDAVDHVGVGQVRIEDVEPLLRLLDHLADRLRARQEPARHVVQQRRRDRARSVRRGEVAIEPGRGRWTAEDMETRQEHQLHLPDDVSGHTHVDIVVAAAGEMVLEAGTADPADLPVDDQHLAVVAVAYLVLMPVEAAIVEQAVPVDRKDVVDDDLNPDRGQLVVDGLGRVKHLSAVAIDADAHLDTGRDLLFQDRHEAIRYLAGRYRKHEDMDRRRGRGHVVKNRWVELGAVRKEVDRGGRGGRQRDGDVGDGDIVPSQEFLGRRLRLAGGDGVRRRGPTVVLHDAEDKPPHGEEERQQQAQDHRPGTPQPPPPANRPRT